MIRYGVLLHPASQKIFDDLVEWGRDLDWRCLESNTQTPPSEYSNWSTCNAVILDKGCSKTSRKIVAARSPAQSSRPCNASSISYALDRFVRCRGRNFGQPWHVRRSHQRPRESIPMNSCRRSHPSSSRRFAGSESWLERSLLLFVVGLRRPRLC